MSDESYLKSNRRAPEAICEQKSGWDIFAPEVAWFIYDFFKYDLNGYEKLMFYCYYVNGMTLEEIGEAACCSFQNVGMIIKKIDGRLYNAWKNQAKWREEHDSKSRD